MFSVEDLPGERTVVDVVFNHYLSVNNDQRNSFRIDTRLHLITEVLDVVEVPYCDVSVCAFSEYSSVGHLEFLCGKARDLAYCFLDS